MQTPVLFLIFNRPECTERSFDAIRRARPPRLYVAADGPRADRPGEVPLTMNSRSIATQVDWPCELHTLFRNTNLGCRDAVASAIDWFFEQESAGIILEDDCDPNQGFFSYCEDLLHKYADDDRVGMISGANFVPDPSSSNWSYRFSRYANVWGWASWRRVWRRYDKHISFWPEWRLSEDWIELFPDPVERLYWEQILEGTYRGDIDTWDYQFAACLWRSGMLAVCPNVNLVTNIGFDAQATHTRTEVKQYPRERIGTIVYSSEVKVDSESDAWFFNHALGGRYRRWPFSIFASLGSFPHMAARTWGRCLRRSQGSALSGE